MPSPYYYINTLGTKVSTVSAINMCRKGGPMSFCIAYSVKDQRGCSYHEPSSSGKHCMHWREGIDGACDSIWAQTSKVNPNKVKD